MNNVKYILSNIRGHWAEFRPEDPHSPGYPLCGDSQLEILKKEGLTDPLQHTEAQKTDYNLLCGTLKVGFSGDWTRHLQQKGEGTRVFTRDGNTETVYSPPNERDFAPDRHGNTALWLESKKEVMFYKDINGPFTTDPHDDVLATVKIRAGCELTEFSRLVKLAGGDVWLNDQVREILSPLKGLEVKSGTSTYQFHENTAI